MQPVVPSHPNLAADVAESSMAAGRTLTPPTRPARRHTRAVVVAAATVAVVTACVGATEPRDTQWRVLFGEVEGFSREAGYRYLLRVAERPIRNPPLDAPGVHYRLVALLSKTRVTP